MRTTAPERRKSETAMALRILALILVTFIVVVGFIFATVNPLDCRRTGPDVFDVVCRELP